MLLFGSGRDARPVLEEGEGAGYDEASQLHGPSFLGRSDGQVTPTHNKQQHGWRARIIILRSSMHVMRASDISSLTFPRIIQQKKRISLLGIGRGTSTGQAEDEYPYVLAPRLGTSGHDDGWVRGHGLDLSRKRKKKDMGWTLLICAIDVCMSERCFFFFFWRATASRCRELQLVVARYVGTAGPIDYVN